MRTVRVALPVRSGVSAYWPDAGGMDLDDRDAGGDPDAAEEQASGGWSKLTYLGCTCEDDTSYELCMDSDRETPSGACAAACDGHGGAVGVSSGPGSFYCKTPLWEGPDRLTCRCADGHEETFCASLWCVSEDQQQYLCEASCGEHGGTVSTSCEEIAYDACLEPGENLVVCACENGTEVRVCSSRDCMESSETMEACVQPCANEGGWLGGLECYPQHAACM